MLKPSDSAHPSSRSMVRGSNVAACHISSWLIAVLGMKLLPTSQPVESAHARARSFVQTARAGPRVATPKTKIVRDRYC